MLALHKGRNDDDCEHQACRSQPVDHVSRFEYGEHAVALYDSHGGIGACSGVSARDFAFITWILLKWAARRSQPPALDYFPSAAFRRALAASTVIIPSPPAFVMTIGFRY